MANLPPVPAQPGFFILKPQSRHAACDRCRAQKLRCQYNDNNTNSNNNGNIDLSDVPCQRCQRAGVECTQSPAMRIGRPIGVSKGARKPAQHRRSRVSTSAFLRMTGPSKDSKQVEESTQHSSNPLNESDSLINRSDGEETTAQTPMSSIFDGRFDAEIASNFLQFPDLLEQNSSSIVNAWETQTSPHANSLSHQEARTSSHDQDNQNPTDPNLLLDEQPFSIELPSFDNVFTDSNTLLANITGQSTTVDPTFIPPASMPLKADYGGFKDDTVQGNPQYSGKINGPCSKTLSQVATNDSLGDEQKPEQLDEEHAMIQKLSAVAVNLYKLTVETTKLPASGNVTEGCHSHSREYPIDTVLNTTQDFVLILNFFMHSSCPLCAESIYQNTPLSCDTSSSYSPAWRQGSSSFGGTKSSNHTCCRHQGADNAPEHGPIPDIHTVLIIISCYTRIMRIYSNLLSYIRQSVLSGKPPNCMTNLPKLQLGEHKISNDGGLQAFLFVQLGIHSLERVNRLLGSLLSRVNREDEYKDAAPAGQTHPHRESSFRGSSRVLEMPIYSGGSANIKTSYLRRILDMAILQENLESRLCKRREIGRLEEDIKTTEQLLWRL